MTHAWLITGPPGSGRSVAALCFAAALQCTSAGVPGCGECRSCTTTMAGTHADVRRVIPEGLSIGVDDMRAIVQIASRRASTGRWQIVLIEDADRLTEGAANALLKVVEEPPPSTVFLLCAPSVDPEDIAITLRSRCRHVALVTPPPDAIAQVLIDRDGLSAETATWAVDSVLEEPSARLEMRLPPGEHELLVCAGDAATCLPGGPTLLQRTLSLTPGGSFQESIAGP